MACRTLEGATFLGNQVNNRVPISAAPYSLAVKAAPEQNVAPKSLRSGPGKNKSTGPKPRQMMALSTMAVLNFIFPPNLRSVPGKQKQEWGSDGAQLCACFSFRETEQILNESRISCQVEADKDDVE